MTDQAYYELLVDKYTKLGYKGANVYNMANSEFSRWKARQENETMAVEHLPEIVVTAPRSTATITDNSDTTSFATGDTDFSPQHRTALANGVTYNAREAAQYEKEAQDAASKVGLGLGAAGLSVAAAPVIGTGIGAGLNGYAAFQAAHPLIATGIDVAGTIDGIRNFFSGNGVQKTFRLIKEGNYGRAALSGVGDTFDILGTGELINLGRKIAKPAYRAGHAYVSIEPWGYNNPVKRGKTFVKSLLTGKEADVSIPKWDINAEFNNPIDDIISRNTRDDAWRKYLGLPETHNMYIQNPDGTYRYNLDKIAEIEGYPVNSDMLYTDFRPKIYRDKEPSSLSKGYDFITGAGGNLTGNYADIIGKRPDGRFDGIQTIEDVWDLQPLQEPASHLARELELKYPLLKKKPFAFIPKTIRKVGNIEIAPIVGGKPFTMKTEIPFITYKQISPLKRQQFERWKDAEQNPDLYYDLYKDDWDYNLRLPF